MSTRGAWGIKRGNKLIVQYNHFDSYPTGLGKQTITDWLEMTNE